MVVAVAIMAVAGVPQSPGVLEDLALHLGSTSAFISRLLVPVT